MQYFNSINWMKKKNTESFVPFILVLVAFHRDSILINSDNTV